MARLNTNLILLGAALTATSLAGCSSYKPNPQVVGLVEQNQFGKARDIIASGAKPSPSDRNFILDRMKLLTLAVDDGVPEAAEAYADRLYDMLRSQGLNDDKTIGTFIAGESATRVYKGEPYEQALAYSYISIFDASQGEWGNARTSADDSLFLLRDFSESLQKTAASDASKEQSASPANAASTNKDPVAAEQVAQREAIIKAAQKKSASAGTTDSLGIDYRAVASDFELGYALKAIAARNLGETEELREAIATLKQVAPSLSSLADTIATGGYNTVIIAAYGTPPRKTGSGMDDAIAIYPPSTASDYQPLQVSAGGNTTNWPIVTDVNRLAADVRWNNLEDMRLAKSYIGTGLVAGGAVLAVASNDQGAQLAGLGIALAGLAMKATAAADTRHNEVFPQRFYVALMNLPSVATPITLQIEGKAETRLSIPAVVGPDQGKVALHYVRLPMRPVEWSSATQVAFANDASGNLSSPTLPYILGGRCVRVPTEELMSTYYAAGLPRDVTLAQLLDVYRDEGILIVGISDIGEPRRHILEGGNWLYTPDRASVGFVRLFCSNHPPYVMRSATGQAILARLSGANKSQSRREEQGVDPSRDSRLVSGTKNPRTETANHLSLVK